MTKQLTRLLKHGYGGLVTRVAEQETRIQTGALPWRLAGKRIEVLLITSRGAKRWGIPKGWPMPGKTLAEAAAQEAFEEAGVQGTVNPDPIGSFRHIKQLIPAGQMEVDILVHHLWVDREYAKWPEANERKRKWLTPKDAAKRVESPELRELILQTVDRPPQPAPAS